MKKIQISFGSGKAGESVRPLLGTGRQSGWLQSFIVAVERICQRWPLLMMIIVGCPWHLAFIAISRKVHFDVSTVVVSYLRPLAYIGRLFIHLFDF